MFRISKHNTSGFSIPELMMVIATLAVVMAVAVPYMRVFLVNVEIKTASEALLNGLQVARSEAVRRNTNIQFKLTTKSGWTVGCETTDLTITGGVQACPAMIQSRDYTEGTPSTTVLVTPVGATTVTYNGLGQITSNSPASQTITRLDIDNTTVSSNNTRELSVLIEGNSARSCNPSGPTGDAGTC